MFNNQLGYTMVEIIIVIGIIMIVSTGATLLFLTTQANNQREVVVNEITSSLRKAQTRAMSGDSQSQFGIYFSNDRYLEFIGCPYSESDPENIETLLPIGVRLENIDFDGNNYVCYEKMTGEVNDVGYVDVSAQGIAGYKRIIINKLGVVNLEIIE